MSPATTHEATSLPGISAPIAEANRRLRALAESDAPVFITGEQGTEKAFAAKVVHLASSRASQPLFKLSVSYKLPPDLAGRFLQANGGTLILNLQREFPADMQYALLEMMTDRSFTDPLTNDTVEADVRLVLTTSLTLDELAGDHELLPELASILETNHVEIPPIRERSEDIPALVRYATNRALETGRSRARGADAQVLALFRKWDWPGNAEDLLLVTAEAALNSRSELIALDDLPAEFVGSLPPDLVEQARKVRLPDAAPAALKPPEAPAVPARVPAPAAAVAVVGDAEDADEARRLQRLIALARRLNTQSQMLARQMSGPLDRRFVNPEALLERGADVQEELAEALESEIDRGLDAILSLRRQVARLNQREKETLLTARDLYRRLLLAGQNITGVFEEDELKQETAILADSLREMDSIIQHVSGSFPKISDDDHPIATGSQMHEEEARAIEETLRRARERERERREALAAAAATGAAAAVAAEPDEDAFAEDEEDFYAEVEETKPLFRADTPADKTTSEEPDETGPMPILPESEEEFALPSAAEIALPPVPPAPPQTARQDDTHPAGSSRVELEKTAFAPALAETQVERRSPATSRTKDELEETGPVGMEVAEAEEDTATGLNIDDFASAFDEMLEPEPEGDPSDTKEKTQPVVAPVAAEDETAVGLRAEDFSSAFEELFDEGKTEEVAASGRGERPLDETQPVGDAPFAKARPVEEEETLSADFMQLLDEAFGDDDPKKK